MKELGYGEWIEVMSSPEDPKAWHPPENDGATLFIQTGQGKYLKYVFEDGRYNLVGEIE